MASRDHRDVSYLRGWTHVHSKRQPPVPRRASRGPTAVQRGFHHWWKVERDQRRGATRSTQEQRATLQPNPRCGKRERRIFPLSAADAGEPVEKQLEHLCES